MDYHIIIITFAVINVHFLPLFPVKAQSDPQIINRNATKCCCKHPASIVLHQRRSFAKGSNMFCIPNFFRVKRRGSGLLSGMCLCVRCLHKCVYSYCRCVLVYACVGTFLLSTHNVHQLWCIQYLVFVCERVFVLSVCVALNCHQQHTLCWSLSRLGARCLPKWFAYFSKRPNQKNPESGGKWHTDSVSTNNNFAFMKHSLTPDFTHTVYDTLLTLNTSGYKRKNNSALIVTFCSFVSSTCKKVECNSSRSDTRMQCTLLFFIFFYLLQCLFHMRWNETLMILAGKFGEGCKTMPNIFKKSENADLI